jgi:hypothetical protein
MYISVKFLTTLLSASGACSTHFGGDCAGSMFCALTSIFLLAYMAFMGVLIQKDYECVSHTPYALNVLRLMAR